MVGDLGENITTRDLDVLKLSEGTRLQVGSEAEVRVTGLRNPCFQIEAFQKGLLGKCLVRTDKGYVRKAGIMSVVEKGGEVFPGDPILVIPPEGAFKALAVV
jgi:MOSC domain-containing protein YiiM